MSFEQRNEYFCKAQTDMQMIYIEAEREVRQLKAENAKLKQELEAVGTAAYLYGRTDLANENAKLRELVSMMNERDVLLSCMTSCNPHGCRFYDSDMCMRIANLMRELGIEVDE